MTAGLGGGGATADLLRHCDAWVLTLDEPLGAHAVLTELVPALHELRAAAGSRDWPAVRAAMAGHPLALRLLQDPLIARAWRRGPQGVASDTALADLLLRHPASTALVDAATPLGRNLYTASAGLPWPEATRERQRIVARLVDATAERRHGATVLAVNPGLMREAPLSSAASRGGIARWFALEADPAVLAALHSQMPLPWLHPIQRHPLEALEREPPAANVDLIYQKTLELWDDDAAQRLIAAALGLLRPGGRLVLCNRVAEAGDDAFWSLGTGRPRTMRDETGLKRLVALAGPRRQGAVHTARTMNGAIAVIVVEAG